MIVISGPSGVGKDSVIRQMKKDTDSIHFVITVTTRKSRPSERDGVDYYFVSPEAFQRMIQDGELLEYARVYQDYKGVPKAQVQEAFASGKDVVLRIDVQGAETIRRLYPESLQIFLTTENEAELIRRLKSRKTETPEQLKLRIATVRQELESMRDFDYVVINRDNHLDEAAKTIFSIIRAEHQRIPHRKVNL